MMTLIKWLLAKEPNDMAKWLIAIVTFFGLIQWGMIIILMTSCVSLNVSHIDIKFCEEMRTKPPCEAGGLIQIYEDLPEGRMKYLYSCNCANGELLK